MPTRLARFTARITLAAYGAGSPTVTVADAVNATRTLFS